MLPTRCPHGAALFAVLLLISFPRAGAQATAPIPSQQLDGLVAPITKHQLEPCPLDINRVILSVGEADWPFPIPIVRTGGKGSFGASQADVEMRAPPIGANEMDAVEIAKRYVEAQQRYAEDHGRNGMPVYAPRLVSTPGQHDGLYGDRVTPSLIPEGLAQGHSKPHHGYYFRILEEQAPNAPGGARAYKVGGNLMGGFGLVAWPVEYGVSGIHTFIVNHNGTVFEKDRTGWRQGAGGGHSVRLRCLLDSSRIGDRLG